jgi:chitin disaccharide deacetylase
MTTNFQVKWFLLFFLAVAACIPVRSQVPGPRLIVRGDDMGFSHAGNLALVDCNTRGIERSVEVLVPSPWFPEAVALLKKNPGIDPGVHLALTSEWENVKWRPLTSCPSLTDSSGYFFSMIWANKNYPTNNLQTHTWDLGEIEKELRAQIELAKRKIPGLSHYSVHMGFDALDPRIHALVLKLGKEYGLAGDLPEMGILRAHYLGPSKSFSEKLGSFLEMLDSLVPGKTYLFVDHPAFDSPELRAIFHTGYEQVAADRQGVASLWVHPRVLARIRERNISLTAYRDLVAGGGGQTGENKRPK